MLVTEIKSVLLSWNPLTHALQLNWEVIAKLDHFNEKGKMEVKGLIWGKIYNFTLMKRVRKTKRSPFESMEGSTVIRIIFFSWPREKLHFQFWQHTHYIKQCGSHHPNKVSIVPAHPVFQPWAVADGRSNSMFFFFAKSLLNTFYCIANTLGSCFWHDGGL